MFILIKLGYINLKRCLINSMYNNKKIIVQIKTLLYIIKLLYIYKINIIFRSHVLFII